MVSEGPREESKTMKENTSGTADCEGPQLGRFTELFETEEHWGRGMTTRAIVSISYMSPSSFLVTKLAPCFVFVYKLILSPYARLRPRVV